MRPIPALLLVALSALLVSAAPALATDAPATTTCRLTGTMVTGPADGGNFTWYPTDAGHVCARETHQTATRNISYGTGVWLPGVSTVAGRYTRSGLSTKFASSNLYIGSGGMLPLGGSAVPITLTSLSISLTPAGAGPVSGGGHDYFGHPVIIQAGTARAEPGSYLLQHEYRLELELVMTTPEAA